MFWNLKKTAMALQDAARRENVSEPVVTLIRLMEAEPDRFEIELLYNVHTYESGFVAVDSASNERIDSHATWATMEEQRDLYSCMQSVYFSRLERVKKDERQRLTEIYCGEQA